MIRAVFFDWYSTLANIDLPRSQWYINMFRELGIEVPFAKAARGILRADAYLTAEHNRLPLEQRTREERADMYTCYPRMILSELGLKGAEEVAIKVRDMMRDLRKEMKMVSTLALFDDALPAIKTLKDRGILLGVISNASRELSQSCREMGLLPYLDMVLTSQEAGAAKPEPLIFLTALKKLDVLAEETVYVGDQYEADVLGARGAGIRPILIDRFDLYAHITDCPKIQSLTEVVKYLT